MSAAKGVLMAIRILAADDEKTIRTLYGKIFPAERYSVTFAESVAEAHKLLDSGTYDLLISDLLFPDGTGLELIRRFREEGPDRSILITGALSEEALSLLEKKEGLIKSFCKPFSIGELLKLVDNFSIA